MKDLKIDLFNAECLEKMKELKSESFDLILTDPPYGTIKDLKDTTGWDIVIDVDEMMSECARLLKNKGIMILFCQEPFTSKLLNSYNKFLKVKNKAIWLKNCAGNPLNSKRTLVNFYEEMIVIEKRYSENSNKQLRDYSRKLKGIVKHKRLEELKFRTKVCHFLESEGVQFSLPTRENYEKLCEYFNLKDELKDEFIDYDQLEKIKEKQFSTFNLRGLKQKKNVFEYKKPGKSVHPTQKPVELLEDLILTYSNEKESVLDFTMGSGSTGVACLKTNRNFTGIELNDEYFKIAVNRIEEEKDKD